MMGNNTRPRSGAGELLIGLGVGHDLVGVGLYWDALGDIVRAGLLDAIGTHADRDAALWFIVCGYMFVVLGVLARWTERHTGTVPAAVGWAVLGLCVVLGILLPISGAWLGIALGAWIVRSAQGPRMVVRG